MIYEGVTLRRLRDAGYPGRVGHACMYDALDQACKLINPESYLEIGVFDGCSALAVVHASPNLKRMVLCDTFGNDWLHWQGGPRGSREPLKAIPDALNEYSGILDIVIGDSNATVPKLAGPFDLITVDGDHTYQPAYNDVKNVYPLLRVGGLLVWDDSSRAEMRRITKELIEPWKMKHLFTFDDGDDTTSVYEKVST